MSEKSKTSCPLCNPESSSTTLCDFHKAESKKCAICNPEAQTLNLCKYHEDEAKALEKVELEEGIARVEHLIEAGKLPADHGLHEED